MNSKAIIALVLLISVTATLATHHNSESKKRQGRLEVVPIYDPPKPYSPEPAIDRAEVHSKKHLPKGIEVVPIIDHPKPYPPEPVVEGPPPQRFATTNKGHRNERERKDELDQILNE